MNTRQLTYFLEIAQKKNMNKAAESLYISQSSLSQYLSRLEGELGALLFYRTKGNLTLTPAGELYRTYAQKVLELEREMKRNVQALASPQSIRVGVNSIWANRLVTDITNQFHIEYPNVTIQVFEDNHKVMKHMINEEELDIAILATDSMDTYERRGEILRNEEIVFAVSSENRNILPGEESGSRLTLPQLMERFGSEGFILPKSNSSFRPMIQEFFKSEDFHPNIICQISNMSTVHSMVYHNIGVAFMPSSSIFPDTGIVWYRLDPGIFRLNIMIHRTTLSFRKEERKFMELVRTYPLFSQKD